MKLRLVNGESTPLQAGDEMRLDPVSSTIRLIRGSRGKALLFFGHRRNLEVPKNVDPYLFASLMAYSVGLSISIEKPSKAGERRYWFYDDNGQD